MELLKVRSLSRLKCYLYLYIYIYIWKGSNYYRCFLMRFRLGTKVQKTKGNTHRPNEEGDI